ncbi:M20/M25/M40 family metallo-hydrolase [bacterium]|nr:M20/M25/M40 family metallo-hydrolase [bacterium]
MEDNKKFLYEYLNAYAPVAQEGEGQQIWTDYIKPYVDFLKQDAYGTSYGVLKRKLKKYETLDVNTHKVVIEAHCDEIAWIITNIEETGVIRVRKHGGSDNMIAPSKTVMIHTHDGNKVPGVFGWPAIHTRVKRKDLGYADHELWVDTGFDSLEAVNAAGVEIGCLITFDDQLQEMGDYYVGKALDNKIGGYIIAEVLRRLREDLIELPYDLYVVNSVQEEVGLFGAKKIAKKLQADLALVTDVCHNTSTPKMDLAKHGPVEGGKGPSLEYASQNHRGILNMLKEVAKTHDIPLQHHVGSYGNDTVAFFLENTPTAILGMPLKYMHSTVEMAHKEDVEACIELYIEFLKALTPEKINKINNI